MNAFLAVGLVLAFSVVANSAPGQIPSNPPDTHVDPATKTQVIDALLKKLNGAYVFEETAKKMDAEIRRKVEAKEYESITDAREFAKKLTEDLQSISKDRHLGVRYFPQVVPENTSIAKLSPEQKEGYRQFSAHMNHGFQKVERMEGNIGYVDLRGFTDPEMGAETAAAAMTLVANTDALILDLRQNMGGEPGMVALVCSYFFGANPVHLNDLYWRESKKTEEFWTKASLPGRRYEGKDVYVLTSKQSFSAAEECAYNLQTQKRAVIVGEVTGGGAHTGEDQKLSDHFGAYIPAGRAINPVTHTNWEGVGVRPDVEVSKEQALKTAYLMALNKALDKATAPNFKNHLKQMIEQQQKELDEMKQGSKKSPDGR